MKAYLIPPLLQAVKLALHDWSTPDRVRVARDDDWRQTQQLMNANFPNDGYYLNRKRHWILRLPVIRHLRYLWHRERAEQHIRDCGVDTRMREEIRRSGGFYVDDWHLYALRRGWW